MLFRVLHLVSPGAPVWTRSNFSISDLEVVAWATCYLSFLWRQTYSAIIQPLPYSLTLALVCYH